MLELKVIRIHVTGNSAQGIFQRLKPLPPGPKVRVARGQLGKAQAQRIQGGHTGQGLEWRKLFKNKFDTC